MKTHHFFPKEDGNIYVIPEMPEKPKKWNYQAGGTGYMDDAYVGPEYYDHIADYEQALDHAKESALLVENQKDVLKAILKSKRIGVPITDGYLSQQVERFLKSGQIYSLECGIEVSEKRRYKTEAGNWTQWYLVEPFWVNGEQHESKSFALITFSEPSKEVVEDEKEIRHAIQNLTAVLHGDGGHYREKHGLLKAIEDAQELLHHKWVLAHTDNQEEQKDSERVEKQYLQDYLLSIASQEWDPSQGDKSWFSGYRTACRKVIELMEKQNPPVEEPTQEELSNEAERFFNENYSGTAMSDFLKPYIINTYKMAITRKQK